jgi:hypothetical protein
MKKIYFSLFLSILIITISAQAQHPPADFGGGEVTFPTSDQPCYTREQEKQMLKEISLQRKQLVRRGILPERPTLQGQKMVTKFEWPLRQADGSDQASYYATINYVDLDPSAEIMDYQCNARSYNGHNGNDYSSWPFWWKSMDENLVEVVAGAPGIIVNKFDGNFDHNCSCTGMWNAVYVEHSDGSVAWYGHLKTNSLTEKAIGESVVTGEYLGVVGSSGCSSNPHLHFEIRDNANNVIDPYSGDCNDTTTESWWVDQKPYREPSLNEIFTHFAAPEINGFCPNEEIPNLSNQFNPGDVVYVSTHFRDQLEGDVTDFVIKNPAGEPVFSWDFTSSDTHSISWWWWFRTLPADAPEGTWTFEATYYGNTSIHPFQVGNVTNAKGLNKQLLQVFPNPVSTALQVQKTDLGPLDYVLYQSNGEMVRRGQLLSTTTLIDMEELASGVYFLEVADPESGKVLYEKVVK